MKYLSSFNLFESKGIRLPKEIDNQIIKLTDEIWSLKSKRKGKEEITEKKLIGTIQFKTLDGADGLVQVFLDPKMVNYYASIDTDPLYSGDPLDFVMLVCLPSMIDTKFDLYNVLYHEMIHAVDPTQSTKFSGRFQYSYQWWSEDQEKYYGHQIETKAIFGEFLNALEKQVEKASFANINERNNIIEEILNYFSSTLHYMKDLSPKAKTILQKCGKLRGLNIIRMVKKYANEKVYSDFLKKLYATCQELKIEES